MAERALEPAIEAPLITPPPQRSNFRNVFAALALLATALLGSWVLFLDTPPQDFEPIMVPMPPPFAPGEVSQVLVPHVERAEGDPEPTLESTPRPSLKRRTSKSDAEKRRAFEERR
jgi:hypothetical protein